MIVWKGDREQALQCCELGRGRDTGFWVPPVCRVRLTHSLTTQRHVDDSTDSHPCASLLHSHKTTATQKSDFCMCSSSHFCMLLCLYKHTNDEETQMRAADSLLDRLEQRHVT
jgi:hypothetical protein